MVAPVHKNTNAPLILILYEVIFCMLAKHIIGDYVFCPHKKITSRAIRIGGALIVIMAAFPSSLCHHSHTTYTTLPGYVSDPTARTHLMHSPTPYSTTLPFLLLPNSRI
jgi:hypothetical protein